MLDAPRPFLHRHFPAILVSLALALVVGVMWILVEQNRALKASLGRTRMPPSSELVTGLQLPDLPLLALTGEAVSLAEVTHGRAVVVGFLTTTCPACAANLPNWRELSADLATRGITFIALSFDDSAATRAYRTEHRIDWPIWTISATARTLLPRTVVPTTLVLDGARVIVRSKVGVLSDYDKAEFVAATVP